MAVHNVEFADGKTIQVDPAHLYLDDTISKIINQFETSSFANHKIKVISAPVLSFYTIKDPKNASSQGLEYKNQADLTNKIILEGLINENKPPFIIATLLNGGAHYQALLIHVKESKLVDVTVINSIRKLSNIGKDKATKEARDELYILNELGLKIDSFTYKEHLIQPGDVDCGPIAIKNLEHEIANYGEQTVATELAANQSVIIRAQQAYALQHSKPAPKIIKIDGKPISLNENLAAVFPLYEEKKSSANSDSADVLTEQKVVTNLSETLVIEPWQAQQIYTLSEKIKPRTPEEHFEYLVGEFYNSKSEDKNSNLGTIEKLIKRLEDGASRQNKRPRNKY